MAACSEDPTGKGHHALVFGASGMNGWAVVNAILNDYPTADSFSRVTALTNRPLERESTLFPAADKLHLVSGIDLLEGSQANLEQALQRAIPQVNNVSHVYFGAYIASWDAEEEIRVNVSLLERSINVIEHLSAKLRFVVLPTGTKAYGIHLIKHFPFFEIPLLETQPRIPEPHASQLFYYKQIDLLKKMSTSKSWDFCTVMPDVMIGFVPNDNYNCIAQVLARYLSLIREIEGPNAKVAFPGSLKCWTIKSNDSSQDIVARFSIYASLHPDITAGECYNIADSRDPSSWSIKWPIICRYFGLQGMGPLDDGSGADPTQYMAENAEQWEELERKYGLRRYTLGHKRDSSHMIPGVMSHLDKDRPLSLEKCHNAWGSATEEIDVKGAWWLTFDRFRLAKIVSTFPDV